MPIQMRSIVRSTLSAAQQGEVESVSKFGNRSVSAGAVQA